MPVLVPDPVSRQPALFTLPSEPGAKVTLRARRCACGYVFHPPHAHGCERCGRGSAATAEVDIAAEGVLTAVATVHVHPKLPVPFTLGRVVLDAGPVIEAWLGGSLATPPLGSRVCGTLVPGGAAESGAPVLDLHFVAVGAP